MGQSRLRSLSLEAAQPVGKTRLNSIELTAASGTAPTNKKSQLLSIELTAAPADAGLSAVLSSNVTGKLEPGQRFTLSGVSSSGAITLYQFNQLDGEPPLPGGLQGTGDTRHGVAPFLPPVPIYDGAGKWTGQDTELTLNFELVVSDGNAMDRATISIPLAPHLVWTRRQPAGTLVPVLSEPIPTPIDPPPVSRKIIFGTLNTNSVSNSATVLPTFRQAGMTAAMQEWRWSTLQPSQGALDATAVAGVQAKFQQFKDLGFTTKTVGLGLHYVPAWAFALFPLGSADQDRIRFRGPDGTLATSGSSGADMLDGVFSSLVLSLYDDFINRMATVYGGNFSEVDVFRITNGSRSELLYPENPAGRYWAQARHVQEGGTWLAADQTPPPVLGWSPSTWTVDQRRAFVEWYHRSSANRAIWFMNKLRAKGFTGRFEIMMPGRGVTITAYNSDINTGLPQSSTLSRGVAWHLIASMLPSDPKIMLWASSVGQATSLNRVPTDADFALPLTSMAADSFGSLRWMRFLANKFGYLIGGENPGLNLGATSAYYNDLTSSGMLQAIADEIAPANGAQPIDAFDFAHGTTLTTDLLAALAQLITAINGSG